jgi:hypothetical protein
MEIGRIVAEFWDNDLPEETRRAIAPPKGKLTRRVWRNLLTPLVAPQFSLGPYMNPKHADDLDGLRWALRTQVPWLIQLGHLLERVWPIARAEGHGAPFRLSEGLYSCCRELDDLRLDDDAIRAMLQRQFGDPETDPSVPPPSTARLHALLAQPGKLRELEALASSVKPWPDPVGEPMAAELGLLDQQEGNWDEQWTKYVADEAWRWLLGAQGFLSERRNPEAVPFTGDGARLPLDRPMRSLVEQLVKRRPTAGTSSVHSHPELQHLTVEQFVRRVITHRHAPLGLTDPTQRSVLALGLTTAQLAGSGHDSSPFVQRLRRQAERVVEWANHNRKGLRLADLLADVDTAFTSKLWARLFSEDVRGESAEPKQAISLVFSSALITFATEWQSWIELAEVPATKASDDSWPITVQCLVEDSRANDADPPMDFDRYTRLVLADQDPERLALLWEGWITWHRRTCPQGRRRFHPDFATFQSFIRNGGHTEETS